jgi:hypothetical protein
LKLWELLDRPYEGALSREQFREILAKAVTEFETQPTKRRRGGRRKSRRSVHPVEPTFKEAPAFDLAEELR